MKNLKQHWLSKVIILLLLVIFNTSCSSDDSSDVKNITAENLEETFDENPSIGDKIATLQATGGQGTLSYRIVSQEPSSALGLNSTTGELVVANSSLFDFETNPSITAVIEISDSKETIAITATITLNNLDDIEHILSASKTAYTQATEGNWIQITVAEYDDLAKRLNSTSYVGTTKTEYNDVTNIVAGISRPSGAVFANVSTAIIPNEGYVFAFKYYAFSVSDVTNSKIKQSSVSIAENYSNVGQSLPEHSGTNEDVCFVLKGNDSPTTDEGYLAFYNGSDASMGVIRMGMYYAATGDVNFLNIQNGEARLLYQGLSTTQKQW